MLRSKRKGWRNQSNHRTSLRASSNQARIGGKGSIKAYRR